MKYGAGARFHPIGLATAREPSRAFLSGENVLWHGIVDA